GGSAIARPGLCRELRGPILGVSNRSGRRTLRRSERHHERRGKSGRADRSGPDALYRAARRLVMESVFRERRGAGGSGGVVRNRRRRTRHKDAKTLKTQETEFVLFVPLWRGFQSYALVGERIGRRSGSPVSTVSPSRSR